MRRFDTELLEYSQGIKSNSTITNKDLPKGFCAVFTHFPESNSIPARSVNNFL